MLRPIHFACAAGVVSALLVAADTPARKPKPVPCPSGRYVITQGAEALVADSAPAPAPVVIDGKLIGLGTHCALRPGTVRATRSGTRLLARWPTCGALRAVKLTATIGTDCRAMTGTIKAKKAKAQPFAAALSRCGDGIVDPGAGEACDGSGCALGATCTSGCQCVAAETTTTTTTSLPTTTTTSSTTSTTAPVCPPTTTTTTLPGLCGNRTVDPGETCDDGPTNGLPGDACPANCLIEACTPLLESQRTFTVHFTPPPGKLVQGVTVFVDYPEGQVTILGSGNEPSVLASISKLPFGAFSSANDSDWGLLVTVAGASPFTPDRLFVVTFDDCQCAPPPSAADFTCTVTDASDQHGDVLDGVTCFVTSP
jgi:cysteine-rich repeat protein